MLFLLWRFNPVCSELINTNLIESSLQNNEQNVKRLRVFVCVHSDLKQHSEINREWTIDNFRWFILFKLGGKLAVGGCV